MWNVIMKEIVGKAFGKAAVYGTEKLYGDYCVKLS
jgi:hypothetical protein